MNLYIILKIDRNHNLLISVSQKQSKTIQKNIYYLIYIIL